MTQMLLGISPEMTHTPAHVPADTLPFRRVVVPLNGAMQGERAADIGAMLARLWRAEVMLVRVYGLSHPVRSNRRAAFSSRASVGGESLCQASLHLARLEERLRGHGVRINSRLYQWPLGEATLEVACAGDLVVLQVASEGSSAQMDVPAIRVLTAARVPVLVLPAGRRTVFERRPLGRARVLVVWDAPPYAEAAAGVAGVFAAAIDGRATLFARASDQQRLAERIEGACTALRARGIPTEVTLTEREPLAAAADFARENADLIVLADGAGASRAQTALGLLRAARRPVVVVS
jgi:hypothetical protein